MENPKHARTPKHVPDKQTGGTIHERLGVSDKLKPDLVTQGPDDPDGVMLTTSEIIDFAQGADS